jgi:hypothetical protein
LRGIEQRMALATERGVRAIGGPDEVELGWSACTTKIDFLENFT